MAFIIVISMKNTRPHSNIDFASNTKNAAVVSIDCAEQMEKIA